MSLVDILRQVLGGAGPVPGEVGQRAQQQQLALPPDQRRPKRTLQSEFGGKEFAPSGSLLNFTGGTVFPVDERAAIAQNGGILLQELQRQFGGQPGQPGQPAPQQQQQPPPQPFGGQPSGERVLGQNQGQGAFTPAPNTNTGSDQARFKAMAQAVDELFQSQAAQQASQAKLQLGMQQAEQQRGTETAQAQYEAQQAQQEAEATAQQEAASAGPFQVQVDSGSPLAQRPVSFDKPLSQLPSSFDALLTGAAQGQSPGTSLQPGAQQQAPGNPPQLGQQQQPGLPSALQGLRVNTGPTKTSTQGGYRSEVLDEGPFGTNTIAVPYQQQSVSPNELGPEDILAARQSEEANRVAGQVAGARATAQAERDAATERYRDAQLKVQQGRLAVYAQKVNADAAAKRVGKNITLSPGEKKADEAYGKYYAELNEAGGFAGIEANLSKLERVRKALLPVKQGGEGKPLTGGLKRLLPEGARIAAGDTESVNAAQTIASVVQQTARQILGAQYTQKEGENLVNRAYDIRLSPAENARRLELSIGQIRGQLAEKQREATYFEENGSLKGFKRNTAPTIPGDQTVSQPTGESSTRIRIRDPKTGRMGWANSIEEARGYEVVQ